MNKHTVKRHRFIFQETLMAPWFEDALWDHGIDPYRVIRYTIHYNMDEGIFPINITYTNDLDNVNSMTITIPTRQLFQYE